MSHATETAAETPARTPDIIDQEIVRLHAQHPLLEEQVKQTAARIKEAEVKLGDLFVRSLCDETPQPPEQLAALEQERQAAMSHATTLDRALKQFHSTIHKLEAEKDGLIRQKKRAELAAWIERQVPLGHDLDKLFEQSVLPKIQLFLEQAYQIHGLSSEIGEAAGSTPKTRVMRALQSYFGALLHPAMERISFRVTFSDSVPKR